ncbi:hypothetical protein ACG7TL_008456 [Trametes sanguinea]
MSEAKWTPPALKHNYFLVYIPDIPNAQRPKYQDAHMKHSVQLIQDGTIKVGGVLLAPTSKMTDPYFAQNTTGSWIIMRADSIEKVWEILRQDPFYTTGEVWDHEKITVTPAFVAIPEVKLD